MPLAPWLLQVSKVKFKLMGQMPLAPWSLQVSKQKFKLVGSLRTNAAWRAKCNAMHVNMLAHNM